MRRPHTVLVIVLLLLLSASINSAQPDQQPSASVPRLINVTGVFRPADGQPPAAVETVTLAVYADPQGGTPLWQETQTVTIDDRGRYSLLLGAAQSGGIPPEIFGSDQAHWLGTRFERAGEVEGPRVRLTSVPYALRAAEADTLGGRPASDYLLATGATSDGKSATAATRTDVAGPAGTVNFLPKYVDAVNFGDSALYESGGQVGLGTTTPFDMFHIRFTNPGGNFTGLAVQNLGNTATSYSGMLFFDQNNQLGQFQGFNNVTHEYRINNIARNGGGQFDGSINFMIGSTSRFFVGAGGTIGIGTTAPSSLLDVNNGTAPTLTFAQVTATTYAAAGQGSLFVGRKARGTVAAPLAVQNGDMLAGLLGRGYGTNFNGTGHGGMFVRAAETWTDMAQGTSVFFNTTSNGTIVPVTRMTIASSGNVGIGTGAPQEALEIARNGNSTAAIDAFGTDVAAAVALRTARGTQAAPTVVQTGDALGFFATGGWDGLGFADGEAGLVGYAAENWTPTTRGAGLAFFTTPIGFPEDPSDAGVLYLLPGGNVGVGTPVDVNGLPTATDKLQVFGDIRVGTSGTNGCVKDFSGTGIIGTCSSDRRLKRNITPFGSVLDQLTTLQPVRYYWRASEFPDRHFGNSQSAGLIAQDVEQVLPELVETDSDGYKAVNYSKLPLFTIQAMKELKAENDALKEELGELKRQVENDPLKQRVAELERLIAGMLAGKRK